MLPQGYYSAAINTGSAPLTVSRSKFINNRASFGGQGGTFYTTDTTTAEFTDCLWYNNSAYQGAGVYTASYGGKSQWIFRGCNFTSNVAEQRAGAVWITGANVSFIDTVFDSNKALLGAGVYMTDSGTTKPLRAEFNGCTFDSNYAQQSAAVAWLANVKKMSMKGNKVLRNAAGQSAAGLYLQDTKSTMTGCVFQGNSARLATVLMLTGAKCAVTTTNCSFVGNKVGPGQVVRAVGL